MFFNPYERIVCQTRGLKRNLIHRQGIAEEVRGIDRHIKRFQPHVNQLQDCHTFQDWWQFYANRPKPISYFDNQRRKTVNCILIDQIKNQNRNIFKNVGENEPIKRLKINPQLEKDFQKLFNCTCNEEKRKAQAHRSAKSKRRQKNKIKTVERPITVKYTVKTISQQEISEPRQFVTFDLDKNVDDKETDTPTQDFKKEVKKRDLRKTIKSQSTQDTSSVRSNRSDKSQESLMKSRESLEKYREELMSSSSQIENEKMTHFSKMARAAKMIKRFNAKIHQNQMRRPIRFLPWKEFTEKKPTLGNAAARRNAELENIRENLDNVSQTKSIISLKLKLPDMWSGLVDRNLEDQRMRNSLKKSRINYQRGIVKMAKMTSRRSSKQTEEDEPQIEQLKRKTIPIEKTTQQYSERIRKLHKIMRKNKFKLDEISSESLIDVEAEVEEPTIAETSSEPHATYEEVEKPAQRSKQSRRSKQKRRKGSKSKSSRISISIDLPELKPEETPIHEEEGKIIGLTSSLFERFALRNILSKVSEFPVYSSPQPVLPPMNVEEHVGNFLTNENLNYFKLENIPKNWPTEFESEIVRRFRCSGCESSKLIDNEQTKNPKKKRRKIKVKKIKATTSSSLESQHNCEICSSLCQTEPDPPYMIEMRKRQQREELKEYYRRKLTPTPKAPTMSEKAKFLTKQLKLCYKMLSNCRTIVDNKLKEHKCCDRCL